MFAQFPPKTGGPMVPNQQEVPLQPLVAAPHRTELNHSLRNKKPGIHSNAGLIRRPSVIRLLRV